MRIGRTRTAVYCAACVTHLYVRGVVCFQSYYARSFSRPATSVLPMSVTSGSGDRRPEVDDEIERLRAQAAKLRAEAAALEADKIQAMASAAEHAFQQFDSNKDGQVCLQELKDGLERLWKTELSESRAKELMDAFDKSGDGILQKEEFVTIDRFRTKLDALVRDEKEAAIAAKKKADEEAAAAKLAQAQLEMINDRPPNNTDKILSILPYLLPLMDGLQYGRFLIGAENGINNPLITAVALLYVFYRSIPFSGFVAFFALNILSGNLKINRLIRFNMQQAIFLDFALFFPGLLLGASQILGQVMTGVSVTPSIVEAGYDAVFFSMLGIFAYVTISSLLGITPDKLPIISKIVDDRMPTIDMLDDEGNFIGKKPEKKDDEDKK
jgi:hypothetical protein